MPYILTSTFTTYICLTKCLVLWYNISLVIDGLEFERLKRKWSKI